MTLHNVFIAHTRTYISQPQGRGMETSSNHSTFRDLSRFNGGGAFSCTICSKQSEYRSALHGEIQIIDYRFAIIGFCQPFLHKQHHSFLNPSDCPELDIAALTTGFKLDAWVFVIPAVADDRRVITVHRRLHGADGFAVIFIPKSRALKHQVFRLRQMNCVKALWDQPHIIGFNLHALHIGGGVRLFVLFGQPHGNRLSAE